MISIRALSAQTRKPVRAQLPLYAVVLAGAIAALTLLMHLPTATYSAGYSNLLTRNTISLTTDSQPVQARTTPTVSKSTPASTSNIAQRLVRIGQVTEAQYATTEEFNTWAYSACSTTSMTEVLNAWWGYARYKITDVLKQEVAAKAVSPDLGLLDNDGITRTMRRFGFDTTTPKLTLDEVIDTANKGMPVIVGWPPEKWAGGHLLVVTGGDENTVKLADSSKLNITSLPRATFQARWGGFAAISKPNPYSVLAINGPTLDTNAINRIVAAYHAPVKGEGEQISAILSQYHVDPAIALSFYLHESTMGTAGMAAITHSWGNSRCLTGYACVNQQGGTCLEGQSCYAKFANSLEGLKEWCWQITNELYAGGGKVLVDDIIPTYAPSADNNDEQGYIAALKHSADTWRSGGTTVH